jgi:hypothetical protein
MTHQYEHAANWFLHMSETNNWSHALYTYVAGICYAELLRRDPNSAEYKDKACQLLEKVPSLLQRRKAFGGKRIPLEQFVDRKIQRFKALAGTGPIVDGIQGPVTEEMTYLLCNGQKRMRQPELEDSWTSLELWTSDCQGEELVAMDLMKSVVNRNEGKLDIAKERIETKIISGVLNRKVELGSNEWVAGFAYYEVLVSFCVRG